MIPLQVMIIVLVGAAGTSVVLARDPLRQAIVNGVFGLLVAVLFLVFQAPDVALSVIAVGSVAFPLVLVTALAKVRRRR
jgi:energy-converting hydrogenase B subunit D